MKKRIKNQCCPAKKRKFQLQKRSTVTVGLGVKFALEKYLRSFLLLLLTKAKYAPFTKSTYIVNESIFHKTVYTVRYLPNGPATVMANEKKENVRVDYIHGELDQIIRRTLPYFGKFLNAFSIECQK